jgi:hypothetical protein
MWFDLVIDILAATIVIPIIIGAVVTHGERRKRIAPSARRKAIPKISRVDETDPTIRGWHSEPNVAA